MNKKLKGNTPNGNNILNGEDVVLLRYLSNFWRFLDLSLINCEIELHLSWSKECIISAISIKPGVVADTDANPPFSDVAAVQKTGTAFQTNNAKLYVPVVTLSISDSIKLLENTKQEFKRTISWNKCRSEITTQPKNNNLDYLIDPTFRNINRLFALLFKVGDDDPTSDCFDKYHLPLLETKFFSEFIENAPFFDHPVRKKQEAYKKLGEMSRNKDSATGNLLDYLYHLNYEKLISIHISRQTNASISKQTNFKGQLDKDDGTTIFSTAIN